ncbi:MAG: dTDP-glucose 4,6-dehydratase [Elusimicrobia bacterium CG06_land_8_20_14_3_00_38_11]|nr:MAG: dTDP-glucose 4,6-dehydratase [Elusimicrobia bacterium CG06_land_8_20_14_3_00_38_11]
MRILVTGGAGFIGSNFILYILKKYPDYKIVNLDKLTYAGNKENLSSVENSPRYKFVKGDICDKKLVNSLMKKVDAVVHFAAESHVDRSIIHAEDFVRTNVVGTQILLDAALRCGKKRFHHISTDEVFGELGPKGKFSEKTPYNPRSPYSASKASSDHLVRAYFHTYNLPVTISNCSNNYGPYQFPEKLIPLFITNLIEGKKVPVYGKGQNIRDWIHVDDHNEGVDLILHKGKIGETYCLGGNTEIKNLDITKMILKEFGCGSEMMEFVADRKGHDFRYAIDFSKIKKELGWHPLHTFEQGLKETIIWYKNNEKWWKPLKGKIIKDITKKQ